MCEDGCLTNKVCFINEHAYVVGEINQKAEKYSVKERKWIAMENFPI